MTIAAWIVTGIIAGLLSRLVMPIPRDGGNFPPVLVGVIAACLGGAVAAIYVGGGVIYFNAFSIAWALNAALYALFALRCYLTRGSGSHYAFKKIDDQNPLPSDVAPPPLPTLDRTQAVILEAVE